MNLPVLYSTPRILGTLHTHHHDAHEEEEHGHGKGYSVNRQISDGKLAIDCERVGNVIGTVRTKWYLWNVSINMKIRHHSWWSKGDNHVHSYKKFTFFRVSWRPGAKVMQAVIVPSSNIRAYIMRVLVLLRHDGHCEQHKLHAVPPHIQASCWVEEKKINCWLYNV